MEKFGLTLEEIREEIRNKVELIMKSTDLFKIKEWIGEKTWKK
jgi:hypothetical protein